MSVENEKELLLWVTKKLKEKKIPYALTGSIASSFWGIPRSTHDIDIVITLRLDDVGKLEKIFKRGFYIDLENARKSISNLQGFNIIHAQTGLKIDFWPLKQGKYQKLAFEKRIKTKVYGQEISIFSAEDIIISKLLWYKESKSERHLDDIRGILATVGEKINRRYIENWINELSVSSIWEKILKG